MDKTLYLLDGHSLIFRMYYAFYGRPMINSKGMDTSILFGFTKYVLELIEKERPTHFAVSFDPPGGTFRNRMYSEYKANRVETPQLVIDALEPLINICGALGFPVLMVPDYEADDVIGTVASKTAQEGFKVFMVAPDKDYGQLVTESIFQYKPGREGKAGKPGKEKEVLGPAEVCEKYGIHSPREVIDILAICGDTSDNVPGVRGVGEVGAKKLVGKYGPVPNIYAHINELPPKQREAFEAARDSIDLSRDLVTIRMEVPVEFDTEKMAVSGQYGQEAAELFDYYEFNSLKRYLSADALPKPQPQNKSFEVREVGAAEIVALARQAGRCSVIVEGDGDGIFAEPRRVLVGVAMAECYAAWGTVEDFAEIIGAEEIDKTGVDLKLGRNILHNSGVELRGRLLDIELMHYIIDPEGRHELKVLAKSYLDIDIEERSQKAAGPLSLFGDEDDGEAAADKARTEKVRLTEAGIMALLCGKLLENLRQVGLAGLYDDIEEPLIRVLGDMECEGVKVDAAQLRQISAGYGEQLEQIEAHIRELADEPKLNVMSPKQLGVVLFEKLALDPNVKKSEKKNYSTDEETLSALADRHPIVNEILEYRALRKLKSTYLDPLVNYISARTGRVHTTFNQALTATGRLSSSNPNLQNIPVRTERGREVRRAFVPSRPDGVIFSADYSQIELRIMAHLSGDEHMVSTFRAGMDIHTATAAKIFGLSPEAVTSEQRRIAKTTNFGIIYGISTFGLSENLKISRAEARRFMNDYFANFPSVKSFMDKAVEAARERGYVETLFGRRRYLPNINAKNANERSFAERIAVNAPVQGSAADIMKKAMIGVAKRMKDAGLKSRMVLQVHDELVFDALLEEVEALRAIVVEEMENVIKLNVPLTVECDYGKNWLEAH